MNRKSRNFFSVILSAIIMLFACSYSLTSYFALSIVPHAYKPLASGEPVPDYTTSDPDTIFNIKSTATDPNFSYPLEKGGAIYLSPNSTYTMNGGTISGHSATKGGAIYVSSGATFTMNAGTISSNNAVYGGAIYVENGATCNINGGTITLNEAVNAPAIYVETGGKLKISTSARVIDNVQKTGGMALQSDFVFTILSSEKHSQVSEEEWLMHADFSERIITDITTADTIFDFFSPKTQEAINTLHIKYDNNTPIEENFGLCEAPILYMRNYIDSYETIECDMAFNTPYEKDEFLCGVLIIPNQAEDGSVTYEEIVIECQALGDAYSGGLHASFSKEICNKIQNCTSCVMAIISDPSLN